MLKAYCTALPYCSVFCILNPVFLILNSITFNSTKMFDIQSLLKRKTVKNFLSKKISAEVLQTAIEVAYRTPTSLNSRPVILVDISNKLKADWLSQQQAVQTAQHLFLLAFSPEAGERNAKIFLSGRFGTTLEDDQVSKKIENIVGNRTEWARQQVYLTAGYFSAVLEAQGISGCWIAGFDKDVAEKDLNLPKDYSPELIFACGYANPSNTGSCETESARKFEDFYFPHI